MIHCLTVLAWTPPGTTIWTDFTYSHNIHNGGIGTIYTIPFEGVRTLITILSHRIEFMARAQVTSGRVIIYRQTPYKI